MQGKFTPMVKSGGKIPAASLHWARVATLKGLRYKENINTYNRDNDADNFLKNCSYTGLNIDKKK